MIDMPEIEYDQSRKKNCTVLVSMYVNKKGTKVKQLLSCQSGRRARVDCRSYCRHATVCKASV